MRFLILLLFVSCGTYATVPEDNGNAAGAIAVSESSTTVENSTRSHNQSGAISHSGGNRLSSVSGGGNSRSSGGDARAASGDSIVSISEESAASSAASLYSAECVNGSSAQIEEGGFSLTTQDFMCDSLKMATEHWEKYQNAPCHSICDGICTDTVFMVEKIEICDSPESRYHLEQHNLHLKNAGEHVKGRKWTARFGAWLSDLGPWAALLLLL